MSIQVHTKPLNGGCPEKKNPIFRHKASGLVHKAYQRPIFVYQGKRFCYLWLQKNPGTPYLGVVEGKKLQHPLLIAEKRSRMKIMLPDPEKDMPVKTIDAILKMAIKAVGE